MAGCVPCHPSHQSLCFFRAVECTLNYCHFSCYCLPHSIGQMGLRWGLRWEASASKSQECVFICHSCLLMFSSFSYLCPCLYFSPQILPQNNDTSAVRAGTHTHTHTVFRYRVIWKDLEHYAPSLCQAPDWHVGFFLGFLELRKH